VALVKIIQTVQCIQRSVYIDAKTPRVRNMKYPVVDFTLVYKARNNPSYQTSVKSTYGYPEFWTQRVKHFSYPQ